MLVDGPAEAVLDLELGVDAVRLQLAPLVDVAVGRREGDGEQAHDEQVPQEPEVGRNLKFDISQISSLKPHCGTVLIFD